MPYLKKFDKDSLDGKGLGVLVKTLEQYKPQELAGAINYLNFRIIKSWINVNGKRYWILSLFVGTLVCCVLEVYRKIIAPYENEAEKKNGSVE